MPNKLEYCNECKMLLQENDKSEKCNYCSVIEVVGDKEIYGQLKYHDKFKRDIPKYIEELKDKYNLADEQYEKIIRIFE